MFISPVDTVCVEASHDFLLVFSRVGLWLENASVISVKRDSNLSIRAVRSRVESARILLTMPIDSVRLKGGGCSWVNDDGWVDGDRIEEGDAWFISRGTLVGDLRLGEFPRTSEKSLEPSDATDSKLGNSWSSRSESSSESSCPFKDPIFCLNWFWIIILFVQ